MSADGSSGADDDISALPTDKYAVSAEDAPIPTFEEMTDMGKIGIKEGISYGLGLLAYIIGLILISGFLSGITLTFVILTQSTENLVVTAVGGFLAAIVSILSIAVFIAGIAGLIYKVIADAVSKGVEDDTDDLTPSGTD
jgi:hypothetical protein